MTQSLKQQRCLEITVGQQMRRILHSFMKRTVIAITSCHLPVAALAYFSSLPPKKLVIFLQCCQCLQIYAGHVQTTLETQLPLQSCYLIPLLRRGHACQATAANSAQSRHCSYEPMDEIITSAQNAQKINF